MHTREISVGGKTISLETGRLAKQADGSVIVRLGDTMVLVTACADPNPREGVDFLPLTCDYKESAYASGRIPGGFFKREGKPPEKEVLTSRLIDRPIRPLFPSGWRYETQVVAQVNKPKLKVSKREIGHDFYREVETKVLGPLADAMRIQDKLANYSTVDSV